MPDSNADDWKMKLIDSAFRPTRFSFIVRKIRRILWPFIRPFHFYTLEEVARQIDDIRGRIDDIRGRIGNFESDLSRTRTDVAASVHRQVAIEGEVRRTTDQIASVAGGVERIDWRTKVFLAPTPDGLLFLKEGDYISDFIARGGLWDEHIATVIKQTAATRQGCAIDVGAHLGTLSVIMARQFTRVISFEPNQVNYSLLVANMAINQIDNVKCINGALYSHEAALSLGSADQQEVPVPIDQTGQLDWRSSANLGALMFTEAGVNIFPTQAVTLDSLRLEDVVFIKIDVQGADGEVIAGAMATIRRCRPVVVFEWEELLSQQFAVTLMEVRELFSNAGYVIDVLKIHNEKQTDYVARPSVS